METKIEQKKIHTRITTQAERHLFQTEVKQQLTDLFALLLEMHIDQQKVTKDGFNENTNK